MNDQHRINKRVSRLRRLIRLGPKLERQRKSLLKAVESFRTRLEGLRKEYLSLRENPARKPEATRLKSLMTEVEGRLATVKNHLGTSELSKQQLARLEVLRVEFPEVTA